MDEKSHTHVERLLNLFIEVLEKLLMATPLRGTDVEVTPSLAHALECIYRHGVCSVGGIAHALSITYPAASQLTDRLVKKGLVSRHESLRDRRLSEIALTDVGCQVVQRIREKRREAVMRVLMRMTPESRASLARDLENFIAAAIEDYKAALETCCHCGKEHLDECIVNEVYEAATGTPIPV